jgi:hypothetical protein
MEFYSCFLSYSSDDQDFAERLYADLQAQGVRCWFAPHSVQAGKKLHDQIDEAIRVYDRIVLIISESSMHSDWVKTEISKARQRELREQRQVLFPLRLVSYEAITQWEVFDANTGKDSAREIREYFIPDFSNWRENDEYKVAFARLLRDLKVDSATSERRSDFKVTFAPGLSGRQITGTMQVLADYYRKCGGIGLAIDFELADVLIGEPINVLS